MPTTPTTTVRSPGAAENGAFAKQELARLVEATVLIASWTATRDQLVRSLHAQRVSLRVIAASAGMSHAGVKKLLERLDREAQS